MGRMYDSTDSNTEQLLLDVELAVKYNPSDLHALWKGKSKKLVEAGHIIAIRGQY
jgi:hypothetical protein